MLLLVILVGAIVVLLGVAAALDFRARRRRVRRASEGWKTLQETRRDLHAARFARYQSSDHSWHDRHRRYPK